MNKLKFLKSALFAVKAAGKIHLDYFGKNIKINHKNKLINRVTLVDIKAENIIVKTLQKQFPNHNFLAEENIYNKTDSDYLWIIDPLDGTSNYSHNIPAFAVSIALAYKDEIILINVFQQYFVNYESPLLLILL